MNQIYFGDCLEWMPLFPDHSFDMILCDLPYGTTACKWDTIIPFEPLWKQYRRIIKPRGAIVLTASQPFTSKLVMSNIKWFKYCWVWEKPTPSGFAHAKNMPLKTVEDVCIFSSGVISHLKSVKMPYFPQNLVYEPRIARNTKRNNRGSESAFGDRPSHRSEYIQEFTGYPKQVLRYSVERGSHPTQKPVALFEYLIRTYTQPGERILDNCAGSGTTGVACINTGRRFVLIEREEKYHEICVKRCAEAEEKMRLTGSAAER